MDTPRPEATGAGSRGLVIAATTCAVVVLAGQLAGKAARDAIFLREFAVTNLPLLLAVSSALSIGLTFVFARRLTRTLPVRVVRVANVASAFLLVVEWALLDRFPRPIAAIVYMHQMLLGPILVSGFWSVVAECFDPRTARKVLGTVGTGATIGAVAGAVIAERVAATIGTAALLPAIALLQLAASWRIGMVGRGGARRPALAQPFAKEAAGHIVRVSLLRRLALITVIVTVAAALLDFVFKAVATESVRRPDDLARLFATFHGVVGACTAIVQWLLGRWALQTFGLARTLATLPGTVIVFGATALLAPGVGTFVLLRGAENVIRNSLYREAYEVFYTPLLANERRTTKTIIDVGVERFGDVLGGLTVLAVLAVVAPSTTVLLVGAIVLSVVGVVVALQAQHSYVEALERSLIAHAIDFEGVAPRDRTTRTTLELVTRGGSSARLVAQRASRWPFRRRDQQPQRGALDPTLRRLAELTCGDPVRIRHALADGLLSPAAVAHAIPLLGRADVAEAARAAIDAVAPACIGQLADAIRDPQLPVAVRAQLPRLVGHATMRRPIDEARARAEIARAALTGCLADPEFEIRYRVAEALAALREHHPELAFDPAAVFEGVRRELAVEPAIWRANDLASADAPLSRGVQHLANLLTLALPGEPLRAALLGLHDADTTLRGVALEYLDNVLPVEIRDRMWTVLAIEVPAHAAKRPLEDVLAELLRPSRAGTDDAERDLPSVASGEH